MMMLNKHSNGLRGFGDTFQSSTPVERKCEIANITCHAILTSHGARDTLLCNKINPVLFIILTFFLVYFINIRDGGKRDSSFTSDTKK